MFKVLMSYEGCLVKQFTCLFIFFIIIAYSLVSYAPKVNTYQPVTCSHACRFQTYGKT